MAKRTKVERTPQAPAKLLILREAATAQINEQVQRGQALLQQPVNSHEELGRRKNEYYSWIEYNTEMLRRMFTTEEYSEQYSASFGIYVARETTLREDIQEFRSDVNDRCRRLESIRDRLQLIDEPAPDGAATLKNTPAVPRSTRKVFIVHGHDEALKQEVARFLDKLKLEAIILAEQVSQGRTIIEKFEAHAEEVAFALVLLTPDDLGASASAPDALKPRARQNVILELGYFIGKLGRVRVCALHKGNVELPSDIHGVIYTPVSGHWRLDVAREMKTAGLPVDLNDAF
jgi:predicted nucleotide-binding protein